MILSLCVVKELSYEKFESKSQLTLTYDTSNVVVKELSYEKFESKSQPVGEYGGKTLRCERTKLRKI